MFYSPAHVPFRLQQWGILPFKAFIRKGDSVVFEMCINWLLALCIISNTAPVVFRAVLYFGITISKEVNFLTICDYIMTFEVL